MKHRHPMHRLPYARRLGLLPIETHAGSEERPSMIDWRNWRSLARILKRAREAAAREPVAGAAAVTEDSGESIRLAFEDPVRDAKRRVLVSFLNLDRRQVESLLDDAVGQIEPDAEILICVVSCFCFDLFRARSILFEFLPQQETLRIPDRTAYTAYAAAKFQLILAKWQPAALIVLGDDIETFALGREPPG